MRVLVLEAFPEYSRIFTDFGHEAEQIGTTTPLHMFDMLCLIGGADVDPALYGEEIQRGTYIEPAQDAFVFDFIGRAKELSIPIVGICKGAQQLCVFAGGKLHQHVDNHNRGHDIIVVEDNEVLYTIGGHHQMMRLDGTNHDLIAYSEETSDILYEPEVVHFPDLNALGFQYHPEWMDNESRGVSFFWETIGDYLL